MVLVALSEMRVARAVGDKLEQQQFKNGRELEVTTVIWASGYRPDYFWIHAPVLDAHGAPIHRRGVTQSPGLYFVGMKNQYSRCSSLLHWVREDAKHMVQQVGAQCSPSEEQR